MTIKQLEEENKKLMAAKAKINATQMTLVGVMEAKLAVEAAKAKVEGMSGAEKAAVTQLLTGAGAIKSEEKVGVPGTKT